MNSLFEKFARTAAVVVFGFALSGTALATPIKGDLLLAGAWTADLNQGTLSLTPGFVIVSSRDFAAVPQFTPVFLDDIDISDPRNVTAGTWTIGVFTFVTDKVQIFASGAFYDFVIDGVMTAASFDATAMRFSLSTNPGQNGLGSYSIARVPEPGAVALFGLGLAGLVLIRRRRAA